jgi:hypothetical protein
MSKLGSLSVLVLALFVVSPAQAIDIEWTDFSSWTPYDLGPGEVSLCDGKTVTISITDNTTPFVQTDGQTVGAPFFLDEHSVYENVNDIDYQRFRTRAASAEGNFSNAAPNSYEMTWDFDPPLDESNFFVVGQLLQYNVATITAYDGLTDVTDKLEFEQLRAGVLNLTFEELLSWDESTGVLEKAATSGSNSRYGFFRIPDGVAISTIEITLNDNGLRGNLADEVNYGIGCEVEDACVTDLVADGGSEETAAVVGSVTASDNGDGTYDVTYATDGSWVIYDLHLDVACSVDQFPTTPSGNPRVGQFCYAADAGGASSITFEGVSTEGCGNGSCDCALFAAHAVVVDEGDCEWVDDDGDPETPDVYVCRQETTATNSTAAAGRCTSPVAIASSPFVTS